MSRASLQKLGTMVRTKRGSRGLREAAAEIGTSAPTLSRIESGKMPDLQTFGKLCRWLEVDPASLLELEPAGNRSVQPELATAHFRADRTIDPETASSLAKAILRAQEMLGTVGGNLDGKRL